MRVPSSQGTSIAVHDLGGEGPTLLICHATGFCGGAYRSLAAALAGHHRVFALDARGHGESTPPADGDFDWGGMADDVGAVAAALDDGAPGPLHVVGHSMGGAAALLAEHRRPGTFVSAYLYEPIVPPARIPPGPLSNPMADAARRRREVFPSRAEALWRYASRPPLAVLQAASLAAYVEHGFEETADDAGLAHSAGASPGDAGLAHSAGASPGDAGLAHSAGASPGVRLRCRAEHEARTFESTGAIHIGLVAGVALPTVIAVGGTDVGMVADMSPALAAALPHATLQHHPHLGHFGPLQDPRAIAAAIVAHTRGAA